MKHHFDGYNYWLRLDKGDRLSAAIDQLVAETDIEGGWIGGLGAAQEVTLGFYDLAAKQYRWRTFDRLMEIAALQGNLARNPEGRMMFHIHGAFAGDDFQAVAGHVKDFTAGATVELFVHRAYQPMQRRPDETVGLPILDL